MDRLDIEGYTVYVLGFKSIHVDSPAKLIDMLREVCKPAEVQVLRADSILNLDHIRFAILYALKSFEKSMNIAKTLSLEIILKIAAEDQIDRALAKSGLKKGWQDIVVIVLSEDEGYASKAAARIVEILEGESGSDILRDIDENKVARVMDLFIISEERLKSEHMYPDIVEALLNIILEDIALTVIRR
ncbi:MAG: KEOPS complex subunit Cgi121 [Candidatus Bathyarchaeia archaeon]